MLKTNYTMLKTKLNNVKNKLEDGIGDT